jgi:hypothetical protein
MKIFLSYTRAKDQFNKVSSFRDRLESELSMRSPGAVVFQDARHLSDGQHFPEELDKALRTSDVFLVLVSPAWLQSEWCRREFSIFTAQATDSGRLHRILPVLWVDTPALSRESLDVVAKTLASINYSDWRDLRYENWDAPQNQRQLGKLAESAIALARSPIPDPTSLPIPTPTYRFKYGVRWTPDGTPICNKCGLPLTRMEWVTHLDGQVKALRCSCSELPIVLMEKGEPVQAPDAMKRMSEDLP